jgi:two-component system, response regulator
LDNLEQPLASVLLVEDSPDDERLALRAFRFCGLPNPVLVARDGQEAVRIIERESLALVLLDLKLPLLGGFEVLERVRRNQDRVRVPIVVFTTSDEDRDVDRAYELGANAFVKKPMSVNDYNTIFTRITDFWIRTNRRPMDVRSEA